MSYASIKGQDSAIAIIRRYMAEERMQGGYLFVGPEGIGKRRAALTTAKALNCLSLQGDSCDRCASCLKADKNEHPDVHLIGGSAGDIVINDIRALQRGMSLKAYEGRVKVFILDNAHAMGAEAANALLKILEEPSAHSVIILISDRPAALFKTVVSRCRAVKFAAMPRSELEDFLAGTYRLEPHQARALAYFSEGRIGRALALKDSDFLREKNLVIDGFMPGAMPYGELGSERDDMRAHLVVLAAWFRDLYLLKTGADESELINADRIQDARRCASGARVEQVWGLFGKLTAASRDLEGNVNTKLLMQALREDIRAAVG